LVDIKNEIKNIEKIINKLEIKRIFKERIDRNDTFLDIKPGSGGQDSQDWASMLLRMYLQWAHNHGFKTEIIDISSEDIGIKRCTIKILGEYAYGWMRTESGIHRLVRKSPFSSKQQRHTSFSSVYVYPVVKNSIQVNIDASDLRIDTYRSSGAGGQHVNRTDSAVRITHKPTNISVQCQANRSQHKNREQAMNQLRSKLYEHKLQKKNETKKMLEASKPDIGWGNQIRSYVLDRSYIKDLRTNMETQNIQSFLNGKIDSFIRANLERKS